MSDYIIRDDRYKVVGSETADNPIAVVENHYDARHLVLNANRWLTHEEKLAAIKSSITDIIDALENPNDDLLQMFAELADLVGAPIRSVQKAQLTITVTGEFTVPYGKTLSEDSWDYSVSGVDLSYDANDAVECESLDTEIDRVEVY